MRFDIEKPSPWYFLQFTRVLMSCNNSSICLISPHRQPFIGHIWMFLANKIYENLVYMVIWDSHNPNKHGRVIRYCFYPRIIKEKEHCLISPDRQPFIGRIWLFLANMLYENLVYRVIWDSHNPNKHGRVIRYCFYPRIIKEKEHCLISPDRQPFIGRIWLFLANMLYENLVFMVIWDSHNPNKHGRVIKYWFLSKNH